MNTTDILQRAALAVTIAALAGCSCSGSDQPVGEVHDARVPAEVREAARQRQRDGIERLAQKAGYSAFDRRKHVLFGDLHVHSTYSVDAFTVELPFMGLQGIHTPADACDFARYCANLDFFSLTDHAENFTPEHWQASKDSLRQCAAVSGHDEDPDVIPFAGWEWTQVGLTPETHWGHKNVIFPDLEDERIPARPINSRPYGSGLGIFNNVEFAVQVRWMDPLNWKRYGDLRWLLDRVRSVPECPRGVPSRELPLDCHENAPTPAELFAKLDEWGFDALVIPARQHLGAVHAATGRLGQGAELRATRPRAPRADRSDVRARQQRGVPLVAWRAGDRRRHGLPATQRQLPALLPPSRRNDARALWRAAQRRVRRAHREGQALDAGGRRQLPERVPGGRLD